MVNKRLTWRQLLTVEPVIFLYAYGMFMHQPVIQQYIYFRVSEMKNYTYDYRNPGINRANCVENQHNNNSKNLEQQVQSMTSYIFIGVIMSASIPAVFMSLFMGTWTDRVGRKPALMAPIVGILFESIIALLIMYLKWPIYVLFIGSAVNGFCGFYTTIVLAVMSYIADTTDESERGLRLGVMELLTFLGGAVSQVTSGLWITKFGFEAPYWFILACYVAGILHILLFLPESRQIKKDEARPKLFSLTGLKNCFAVFKTSREGVRRNLLLLMFSTCTVTMTTMGLNGAMNLFLLHSPLCFSPEYVGFFASMRLFFIGLGAVLGIKGLGKCLKELNVARVGVFSAILGLVWFAFADNVTKVFFAPVILMFVGCISPLYRGMMSRMIPSDQQGALFSPVAALDSIFSFLGNFIYNALYPASLKFGFHGFVFVLAAIVMLVPIILPCFLKNPSLYMSGRDQVKFGTGKYDRMQEPFENGSSIPNPADGETSPISRDPNGINNYTESI